MTELYLLNLYPGTVEITITDKTNGNSQTYTLSQYQTVNITNLISSPSDCLCIEVQNGGTISGIQLPSSRVVTFYVTQNPSGSPKVCICYLPPKALLKQILNKIEKNISTYISDAYQEISSLIQGYKSGSSISTANLKSILQQIYDCLQNAINFQNQSGVNFEIVSAWCQIYKNLTIICEELSNGTLTASSLQSLRLPSYSCSSAQTCAEEYCNNLNNFISSLSSTSSSSSTTSSSSSSTSSQSSSTQSSTSSSSTSSSSSSSTSVSSSSSTTSSTSSSTTSTTTTQGQVLAQIQAGDITSLQSEISEIPPDMIPVVGAVIKLYQIYNVPDGTPLSTVVERLLSDIRDAYYEISNHMQEQVNTQQLSQLLQIYNTLASSGLAPASQSASKLSNLVQTSGVMPAVPSVLGQPYPGTVYSGQSYPGSVVNSNSV